MRVIEPEKRDYAGNILIMPKETLFIGGRIMFLCEVDDGLFRTEKLIYEEYGAFYIAKEAVLEPVYKAKESFINIRPLQALSEDLGYNGDPLPEEISLFQKKQKNNSEPEFQAKGRAFRSIEDADQAENSTLQPEEQTYEFVDSDGMTKTFQITDQDSEVVPILNDRCNIVGFLKLPE